MSSTPEDPSEWVIDEAEIQKISQRLDYLRRCAESFARQINRRLPTAHCPSCGDEGHVPGLHCPACNYVHAESWAIVRSDEWGCRVLRLNNRKRTIAVFHISHDS